ncbi:Coenzyme Q-binding protein coq10, mitochondrial [Recurvomyces mirabilis]|uniref:Coenzyme Q-binding protein coq10, mitochondrial n=1 Tax=Recurvomyces mirabilis TaxID=574656 RepID=A0AAE0TR66_9PEZI|nr:Coenzyme Q-binding protein coq10, mitochondrial [Recurvomyces mirabilis]KAK5149789.1 Coenzyme Q-binding protein coq10, mitochondrial [Recurvomyces mirabilis]
MQTLRPISHFATAINQTLLFASRQAVLRTTHQAKPLQQQHHRTFVTNPFTPSPQSLTATRTLQYPSKLIYAIISDVGSYSTFLPYCQESVVTKHSQPASDGKEYPEEATLVIGFNNDVSEKFTSRVYCIPEQVVEAVSGEAETTLDPKDIAHHSPRSQSTSSDASRANSKISSILTRWTLKPYPYKPPPLSALHPDTAHNNHNETSEIPSQERTEVNLTIDYQFANPMYAALSAAAAPKIADKMIDAFEKRVRSVIEGPGNTQDKGKAFEGVLRSK